MLKLGSEDIQRKLTCFSGGHPNHVTLTRAAALCRKAGTLHKAMENPILVAVI